MLFQRITQTSSMCCRGLSIESAAAQAEIHRPDRSPPVRVLALQGDYFRDGRSEIFGFLDEYCRQRKLQFRHGAYTGSGWDVDDYARVMQQGGEDFGQQQGSYMVRVRPMPDVCAITCRYASQLPELDRNPGLHPPLASWPPDCC